MSLTDVRAAIDRIDDQIIALMARRQVQVKAAVGYKRDDDAVRAPDRRAALMDRVRARAVEEGVDPEVVAATYGAMVEAFITLELRELHERS